MFVYYPDDIKGATPINGFVDSQHVVTNLAPGQELEISQETYVGLKRDFKFLTFSEVASHKGGLSGIEDAEIVEPKKEKKIQTPETRFGTSDSDFNPYADAEAEKPEQKTSEVVAKIVEKQASEKSWKELVTEATKRGIYKVGMKKPDLIKLLNE